MRLIKIISAIILMTYLAVACGGGGGSGGGGNDPSPLPTPADESPYVSVGSNAAQNILSANFSMKVVMGPSFAGETTSNSYRMISSISIN